MGDGRPRSQRLTSSVQEPTLFDRYRDSIPPARGSLVRRTSQGRSPRVLDYFAGDDTGCFSSRTTWMIVPMSPASFRLARILSREPLKEGEKIENLPIELGASSSRTGSGVGLYRYRCPREPYMPWVGSRESDRDHLELSWRSLRMPADTRNHSLWGKERTLTALFFDLVSRVRPTFAN